MKEFDYERKISGVRESSRFEIFKLGALQSLPREFKDVKGKVLDVGCGAGAFTGLLKCRRPELEVYGVDISRKAIKIAKRDFPNINFSVASAYQLPFSDNFLDGAVMECVLEHLEDPAKALVELKRVLKPEGLFYSITPLEGDRFVLSSSQKLSWKYQGHFQRFSRSSLLSLLGGSGFKVERYYFWGFLLLQATGVAYYLLLDLLNLPPHFSVISCVTHGDRTPGKSLLSCLRKAVSFLLNVESLSVPKRIPGLFMHIVARKL